MQLGRVVSVPLPRSLRRSKLPASCVVEFFGSLAGLKKAVTNHVETPVSIGCAYSAENARMEHGVQKDLRWRWLILFLGLCACLPVMAMPPLELGASSPVISLAPWIEYWCDENGQATWDDAREAPHQQLGVSQIALGYRHDACWFRARLRNASVEPLPVWVVVDYALLDEVDLFLGEINPVHWRLGDQRPFAVRPIKVRFPVVPLHLAPGQETSIHLRVRSTSSMTVPFMVSGHDAFLEHYLNRDWLVGVFYGIGLGLFAYHLVLWLIARERTNRFYVLHLGSALLYLGLVQGIVGRLWPQLVLAWNDLPFLAGYLALLSALLFARDFLETRNWPVMDWVLRLLAGLIAVVMLAQILLPAGAINHLQGSFVIITMMVLMIVGVGSWLRGLSYSLIFVAAWSGFLIVIALFALNTYGLLEIVPVLLTLHGIQLALVLQQILLSFGLAARVNRLKREAMEQAGEIAGAQAESAAKSEFLARMSHEIRTPMNAMLGLAELMRDTTLDRTQRNYLDTLNNAGQSLLGIINDILDYSKIMSGKLELDDSPFNLPDLLEDCLTIFHGSAEQKELQLVADWPDDLPTWVRGDAARLRQVLLNLLSNAIKFTDAGEVRLKASCVPRADGLCLTCQVCDRGIGMSQDQQEQLFESFQQADSSTSRKYGGTGLGLAISRQLIELMGGRIEVESRLGEGTRFGFEVPVKPARAPGSTTRKRAINAFPGLRVLLVEDNAVNQMVVRALLQKLGADVLLASRGQDALSKLEYGDLPDLILMDCEMPDMDGYETTRRIRAREAQLGLPRMPILALTAHALAEHREKCLASGMDDHLAKPLTLVQLVEALKRWT